MDHLLSKEQPRASGAMVEGPPARASGIPLPFPFRTAVFNRRPIIALERVETDVPSGGIAQLAERQLCKLDVAGSNPAASTSRLRLRQACQP